MEPISIIIAVLALIFSIWSFWTTRSMALKQMKSSTYSSIMSRLFELNRIEVEQPQLFKKLYDEFDSEAIGKGKASIMHYSFMILNLYGEIYTQHKRYDLFDDEQMRVWENRITNDLRQRKFLRGFCKREIERFSDEHTEDFKLFINRAIDKAERPSNASV